MSKQESQQIFERLSVLLFTVAKGEQVQQCIRETMTTHPLFSPLSLFRYISGNGTVIKKEHLFAFLEENKQAATEDQIKVIFESEGSKKSWQYSDFLQVVYPYNSAILREITNHHLKKYPQLSKHAVDQSTITAFLILLTEKLHLIRKLQVQKGDSLLKVSKERVKKVLISIKKLAGKQPSHCENDETIITGLELRYFLKSYVSVQEGHFLYLARRLGTKNGSFPIQNLQKFLRPSKKQKKVKPVKIQGSETKNVLKQSNKVLDQIAYKQQLYKGLTQSIKQKDASTSQYSSALRQKISNTPQKNTIPLKQEKRVHIISQNQNPSFYKKEMNKCKKQVESLSFKRLFLTFIETFLPAAKQLNELRIKATQQRIDFLALFKQIDRSHRGVASAQDLHQYYIHAGGKFGFIPKQFQLIISRYGQSEQPWLTFAEFCDMVRTEDKEGYNRSLAKFGQNPGDLVLNILELSLNNELALMKIRRSFSKSDAKNLFDEINCSKTGFMNYQQLKKYLNEANLALSMQDLMIILKQLDKSRNGVVVEHEFVQYFAKH